MSSDKSQNDNNSKLLALLLLLGAGVLVLMYFGGESSGKSAGAGHKKTPQFTQAVNKHLMLTNEKMEFEKRRLEIENSAADFNNTKAQTTYNPTDSGLDLSNDSRAAEVAEILGRGQRQEGAPMNPHDVIQKELFNREQEAAYSEAYKEEYARQFVENAARGGYKVILDDQYRVKQVLPIQRTPGSSMDIFNGSTTSQSSGGAVQ